MSGATVSMATAPCATLGVLLGLYGALALLYGGDARGGDPYVTLAGERLDATAVGGASLASGCLPSTSADAARAR